MSTMFVPDPPTRPGMPFQMETTGKYLVLLAEEATEAGVSALRQTAGLRLETMTDSDSETFGAADLEADNVLFERLGVAVVAAEPDQLGPLAVSVAEDEAVLAVEPERVVYAIEHPTQQFSLAVAQPTAVSSEYLRGYRDAIDGLLQRLGAGSGGSATTTVTFDESQRTWGLDATAVTASRFAGRGVRVAVLDTGIDLDHPDFTGRLGGHQSFVGGEDVQDAHGHGTHCIGTACGPERPSRLPRYGVAYEAAIYAGKVLSNRGSGGDGGILHGITWAMTNRCQVVSMSLGARTTPGTPYSAIFETAARRAGEAGTLVIAAAGNDSQRHVGLISTVSHPANCPSIIAVAALDSAMAVASFSNRGMNPDGGQIDIAGPGVQIYSSWPRPAAYNTISGTSMATPHVAGIAALHAEANPGISAVELSALIGRTARRLQLPSADVGAGLVQAP